MTVVRAARWSTAIATLLAGVMGGSLAAQAPTAAPTPESAAAALLERTAAAYTGARTLRASFTQTLTTSRAGAPLRSRGEFLQQGARRFAFRFTEPADDRIVADGEGLWLYLPSTMKGQAIRMPRGAAAGAGLDLVGGLLTSPTRRYDVRATTDTVLDGRTLRRLLLTPRAAGTPFTSATMWIDPAGPVIRRAILLEPTGFTRTLEFTRVRLNSTLPRDAFRFVPPAGVRVVDQAALLSGTVPP